MDRLETRTGYRPNHRSFGQFMRSEQAHAPAMQAARDIAVFARNQAERGESDDRSHYADAFKVYEKKVTLVVGGNPRAIAIVYNDDDAAPAMEFGQRPRGQEGPRTEGRRTLRRAGEVAPGPVVGGRGW